MTNLLLPTLCPLPKTEKVYAAVVCSGLEAYLVCLPCSFPPRYAARTLSERLHQIGIQGPLVFESIQRFVESCARGNRPMPALVARGTPPTCDSQGGWIFQYGPLGSDPPRLPHFFKAGEIVCRLLSGHSGKAGVDVWGKPLPPPPAVLPSLGEGLRREGDTVCAERNGYLVEEGGTVRLVSDCRIDGLTLALFSPLVLPSSVEITGTVPGRVVLETHGDILVRGDLGKGTRLRTSGSVRIYGELTNAVVTAGGDIDVHKALHSTLQADGDIRVSSYLGDRSTASSLGLFFAEEGAGVENSTVESLRGADLWDCGGQTRGTATVAVGLTQVVDREIAALEQQINRLALQREKVFEGFNALFRNRVRSGKGPGKLSPQEQERYHRERETAAKRQEELDRQIAALRSKQRELSKKRKICPTAVIRIRHKARPVIRFCVRKRIHVQSSALDGPLVVKEGPDRRVHVHVQTEPLPESSS